MTGSTVSFFGFTLVVGTRGEADLLAEPVRRAIQGTRRVGDVRERATDARALRWTDAKLGARRASLHGVRRVGAAARRSWVI